MITATTGSGSFELSLTFPQSLICHKGVEFLLDGQAEYDTKYNLRIAKRPFKGSSKLVITRYDDGVSVDVTRHDGATGSFRGLYRSLLHLFGYGDGNELSHSALLSANITQITRYIRLEKV